MYLFDLNFNRKLHLEHISRTPAYTTNKNLYPMKKIIIATINKTYWQFCLAILLFILCSSQNLYSQLDTISLSVSNTVGTQQVAVDVTVENYVEISSGQFTVQWNSDVLEYDTIGNFGLSGNPFDTNHLTDDLLLLLFVDEDLVSGASLPDGTVLLTLYFNVIGTGVSPVSIVDDPLQIEFFNISEGVVPYKINNGEVNGEGAWVNGQLVFDRNRDCFETEEENGIEGWIIKLRDEVNDRNYYATTNADGYYSIFTELGSYELSTFPEEILWSLCQSNFSVELTTLDEINLIDFLAQVEGTFIQGRVFNDSEDENCQDDGEAGFENWQVIIAGDIDRVVSTNEQGAYSVLVPSGTYDISVATPLYWQACEEVVTLTTGDVGDTIRADFAQQIEFLCPQMEVNVSTWLLRRCFPARYHIQYCNIGTQLTEQARIELAIDEFMEVDSASIPFTIENDLYVFELGAVEPGACGTFSVFAFLDRDCDQTVLGQTHCVEAHIYPDSICLPSAANWTGASIKVNGECIGDEVVFNIENVGDGNMDAEIDYIVVEDAIMYSPEPFQLNSGESLAPIALAANGSTYRLEVDQVNGHPGNSMPSISVEGCGLNVDGNFTTGFVTLFPQDDNDLFTDIDCQENIGSFDPNDKNASPRGYGEDHIILENTDLEYLIRFQNTGTDTAFTVVIRDTITELLQLSTIRPGVSSHPYEFEIYNGNVVKITFNNIMLPDSNINEAASHGFFKFQIKQQADLPLGTVLENSAAIYFDFNDPVITNTSWHTIGEFLTSDETIFVEGAKIKVYPNPVLNQTTFELEGVDFQEYHLRIYNATGQQMREDRFKESTFQFDRKGLTTGLYFYEILGDQQLITSGKLILK